MKLIPMITLLAALAAGGCATNSYKSLGLPPEQVAVVQGNPSNLRLVGVDERIQFLEVDGEHQYRGSTQGYPTKLDILPGRHRFLVGYSIYENSQFQQRGELAFEADVAAGKTYRVDLVDEGVEGWKAKLVEVTRRELSDVEKREAAHNRYD